MQVLIVVGGVGLVGALTLGFADFCGDLVDASRARTAADAAALAGVGGGRPAVGRLAGANDAIVVEFSQSSGHGGVTVTVSVRVGEATSTARASDAP